ncbi:Uncharacterised protein [Achromobacter sp. 2789STDY5608615]|nr:Uncharacterised protein [Achromobacter sp. 2789STDY5608615]
MQLADRHAVLAGLDAVHIERLPRDLRQDPAGGIIRAAGAGERLPGPGPPPFPSALALEREPGIFRRIGQHIARPLLDVAHHPARRHLRGLESAGLMDQQRQAAIVERQHIVDRQAIELADIDTAQRAIVAVIVERQLILAVHRDVVDADGMLGARQAQDAKPHGLRARRRQPGPHRGRQGIGRQGARGVGIGIERDFAGRHRLRAARQHGNGRHRGQSGNRFGTHGMGSTSGNRQANAKAWCILREHRGVNQTLATIGNHCPASDPPA